MIITNQNGLEWNDQGFFVGRNDCGRKDCKLCQAATAMFMVAATRLSMLHHDKDLNWVQLFLLSCFISLFDCVMEFCLCMHYNDCVSTETHIFHLFLRAGLNRDTKISKMFLSPNFCTSNILVVCCFQQLCFVTPKCVSVCIAADIALRKTNFINLCYFM